VDKTGYNKYAFKYMYILEVTMNSISYTSARSNLAQTMKKVIEDHAPIAITRKGEGAVVMISMEDYQALEETAYLLRSPENMHRLISAIGQLEKDEGVERELVE
jgi:antitoxin YefM